VSGVLRIRHDNSGAISVNGAVDQSPPAAITNLATSGPTSSSIMLSWTAPGAHGTTGTATSYDVRYATSPITSSNWTSSTIVSSGIPAPQVAGTAQSMTVAGLSASTTYYFAIETTNSVPTTSAVSNSPSGTTSALGGGAPAAITNLATSSPTSSSMGLSWTAPGANGNTGTATSYDVRYATSPITGSTWASATLVTSGIPAPQVAGTAQSMTVTGLSASTTYYFAIETTNSSSQTSAVSNSPSGTTAAASGGTIGNTDNGTSTNLIGANSLDGFRYQASSNLTVTQMFVKIATASSGHLKMAIYSDNNGSPGNFLVGTVEQSAVGTGWQTFNLTSSQSIVSGNYYWLVIWSDDTTYVASGDSASNSGTYVSSVYGPTWPSPFPSHGRSINVRYSMYAQ
jgi:hypothetical protein